MDMESVTCGGERICNCSYDSEWDLDLQIVRGSVNGDIFMDFVQRVLLPNLLPFNGTNPNSVVLLDNCSVRHCGGSCRHNTGNGNHSALPTSFPRPNSHSFIVF